MMCYRLVMVMVMVNNMSMVIDVGDQCVTCFVRRVAGVDYSGYVGRGPWRSARGRGVCVVGRRR